MYRAASHLTDPKGRSFANVCIGCDAFFKEVLCAEISKIRSQRIHDREIATGPTVLG